MMRSMFAGVAGLRNHQIRMDAIGNNIANVNTVGYKGSRVSFQDNLNQMLRGASAPNGNRGGINALQIGLGMNISSIDILQSPGNLQNTGRITDVAIQGDGFFVLSDGGRQYYTRAGNFNLERDGRLVGASNGMIVQGWMADNMGNINNNVPITGIQLPLGQTIAPIATTKIEFGGNLAANTNAYILFQSMTVSDLSTPTPKQATVDIELKLIGFNTYVWTAKVNPNEGSITAGTATGVLTLNEFGVVTNCTGTDFTVTPNGGMPIRIAIPDPFRPNGGFFTTHAAGMTQDLNLAGFTGATGNFDFTVFDAANNGSNVRVVITDLGGGHYQYSTIPTPPGPGNCTILSGGTGTFDWNAADGVTNVQGTPAIVQFTGSTWTTTIQPPVPMDGVPNFPVVERQPETIAGLTFAPVPIADPVDTHTYSVPVLSPTTGETLTILTFTSVRTAAGPPEDYNWTMSAAGGTVSGGTGTWTYDGVDTLNWTITGGGPTVVHTDSGVDIILGTIPTGPGAGNPTFDVLVSGGTVQKPEFNLPDPVITISNVYDSLGNAHTLTTTAVKVGTNEWEWYTVDEYNTPIGEGTLTFNANGELVASTGGPLIFTPPGAQPLNISLDFEDLTQSAGDVDPENHMAISNFTSPFQDGYPMGQLQGFNIDSVGRIIGIFSNGMNQRLAQIAMANFTNPGGLIRSGDTLFEESANSGSPQIGQAGQNGRGLFTPGAIEMSNVDLSQEFTDMITTQRGFQANSRIITTSDEMLQELVNLKR